MYKTETLTCPKCKRTVVIFVAATGFCLQCGWAMRPESVLKTTQKIVEAT